MGVHKPTAEGFRADLIEILDSYPDPDHGGWVIGYRTRETSAAGRALQDDRIYGTEVFSTCDETECHPGWYLWPTLRASQAFSRDAADFIRVRARLIDVHHVKTKWRSRAIWVIGSITEGKHDDD